MSQVILYNLHPPERRLIAEAFEPLDLELVFADHLEKVYDNLTNPEVAAVIIDTASLHITPDDLAILLSTTLRRATVTLLFLVPVDFFNGASVGACLRIQKLTGPDIGFIQSPCDASDLVSRVLQVAL